MIIYRICCPQQHENLTLAINSAKAIGCVVIGIDSHSLNSSQGKKWLVLGLVWQLIKMYLFKQITISQVPGLVNLLREGETLADLMKMSPEEILLRWVNHQLEKVRSWFVIALSASVREGYKVRKKNVWKSPSLEGLNL